MKIVIAPDSFKESLSAIDVARAIATGFSQHFPDADYHLVPVADGGEGTTQALVDATGGQMHTALVSDPLGRKTEAHWGMLGDGDTAVVETAAASGLDLLTADERNPLLATTYGTGELVQEALNQGVRRIILGLGGSATNDGGSGLLVALGAELLDADHQPLTAGGGDLSRLKTLDLSKLDSRLAETEILLACDVDNPLTGSEGASAVFGPQKGASDEMVTELDSALAHFADHLEKACGKSIRDIPGAGAAGGLGIVLFALANARMNSGIDIVLDAVDIDSQLENADLVITGEGRIDSQTIHGKTPIGVARRAKARGCPVIALAGAFANDADVVYEHGIDALFSVVPGAQTLEQALADAEQNLVTCARNVAAVWKMQPEH